VAVEECGKIARTFSVQVAEYGDGFHGVAESEYSGAL
jgi:hypothetical protein